MGVMDKQEGARIMLEGCKVKKAKYADIAQIGAPPVYQTYYICVGL